MFGTPEIMLHLTVAHRCNSVFIYTMNYNIKTH